MSEDTNGQTITRDLPQNESASSTLTERIIWVYGTQLESKQDLGVALYDNNVNILILSLMF